MTTSTETDVVSEAEVEKRSAYTETLLHLADAITNGAIPVPTSRLRLYLTAWSLHREPGSGRTAFLAARGAFPDAAVEVSENSAHTAAYGYLLDGCRMLADWLTAAAVAR